MKERSPAASCCVRSWSPSRIAVRAKPWRRGEHPHSQHVGSAAPSTGQEITAAYFEMGAAWLEMLADSENQTRRAMRQRS